MDKKHIPTTWLISLALVLASQSGCMSLACKTIPAARVPDCLRGESRSAKCPVNLAALRQVPPKEHIVGGGDLLGITIRGVLPPNPDANPILNTQQFQNNIYYPAGGLVNAPSTGVPVTVQADGMLLLPRIDPIDVRNLTMQQVAEKIAQSYADKQILQPGREQIQVELIKARTYRVLVIRGDTGGQPVLAFRGENLLTKQGSGTLIDLPAFENDVLHALTATGGMPGIDAHDCVWILRNRTPRSDAMEQAQARLGAGEAPEVILASCQTEFTRTMIPLRVNSCECLPFGPQDMILNEGDVVYLEPRIGDVFYTGGLLPSGVWPLPRDHDIDILEAIAFCTGGAATAAIGSGTQPVRSGAGPGNIAVPPARAIILRKLADGRQVRIRVDLRKALHDSSERVRILPNDFVMMQFTPTQCMSNTVLNWFNWNFGTGVALGD